MTEESVFGQRRNEFWIESLGREGIRYHEGEKTLYIWTEFLVPKGVAVATAGIAKWDSPHDRELIGSEEKVRILENIREVATTAGYAVEFLD